MPGGVLGLSAGDAGARYMVLPAILLLAILALALWRGAQWRGGGGATRAPAWDCGFIAPPVHLPFGNAATQPSGAGFAQPISRMLAGPLMAARENVAVPPPGSMASAEYSASGADPTWRALTALRAARHAVSNRVDRFRALSVRHALGLLFATLVLLLAVLAVLERP